MTNFTAAAYSRSKNNSGLIPQERDSLIALLFEAESFDLVKLLEFLVSIKSPDFWDFDNDQTSLNYSKAQMIFMETVFRPDQNLPYRESMAEVAKLLWENRSDLASEKCFGESFTPNMDAVLMVMVEHLPYYKAFYEFDQENYRQQDRIDIPLVAKIGREIMAQPTKFEVSDFSYAWIKFHIRFYLKMHREASERFESARNGG